MIHNIGCDKMTQHYNKIRKKLATNLVVDWLIPVLLVMLLRLFFVNDAIALAIASIIPVVRSLTLWIRYKRVNWIGVFGIFGFAIAFSISLLSGMSSLPLKLYHPIITGIIGLILLVSVIIRKPLLLIIIRTIKRDELVRINNHDIDKKLAIFTGFLGIMFLIDSFIHIMLALTLSTVMYLTASKGVTIVILLFIIMGRRIMRKKT